MPAAKNAFSRTKLPSHPTVKAAFALLDEMIGATSPAGQSALLAAESYAALAAEADPNTVAALLLNNQDFPQIEDAVGADVRLLIDEAADYHEADEEFIVGEYPARMDMLLALVVQSCDSLKAEVNGPENYPYDVMVHRIERQRDIASQASLHSHSPALVAAANAALDDLEQALAQRVADARAASDFALSGLPAHPLIQKAYELVREEALQYRPHDSGAMSHARQIAWQVHLCLKDLDPEMIAAALLTQHFVQDATRFAADFSPRVLQLYAASSIFGRRVKSADAAKDDPAVETIRTAATLVALKGVLHDYREHREIMSMADRADCEDEIKRLSTRLSLHAVSGLLPPLLEDAADYLSRAASALLREEPVTASVPQPLAAKRRQKGQGAGPTP